MKRHEFIQSVHKIIGDNLEVRATPAIDQEGRIKARGQLLVGDIDEDLGALADKLGLQAEDQANVE